jgi:FeS assembly SUF system protein
MLRRSEAVMADDIEHLKTNKIVRKDGRVALGVYGQAEPAAIVKEAFGGGKEPAGSLPVDREALRERILETLKSIFDPEIPLNIYDLGLIYGFEIDESGAVAIEMTLTAPGCPVAGMIVEEVAQKTGAIEGVRSSHVTLTWDPPWTKDRMSDEALLELGLL